MTTDCQNRQRVRENFSKRRNQEGELPAFTFPKESEYFADPTDGTLKSSIVRAKKPIDAQISIAPAGASGSGTTVKIEYAIIHNGVGSGYIPLGTEIDIPKEAVFPYDIQLNIQEIPDNGTFLLRYHAKTYLGSKASEDYTIIKDTIPPWADGQAVPVAPTQVPAGTITQKLLDDNANSITFNLSKYDNYDALDSIAIYFEDRVPEESDLGGLTPVFAGPFPDADPKFILTADQFKNVGSGDRYICYVLQDKAGNINISYPLTVHIALGTLPLKLDAPEVPLADDGLLTLLDAGVNPVEAMIPSYLSPEYKIDTITVHWGSALVQQYVVNPDTSFPMPIMIPKATLKSQYNNGTGGIQQLPVYYTLGRSGGWTLDSYKNTINVDFSYVGPELPDWPNPVNTDLPEPEVTGPTSGKTNELDDTDTNQDAGFSVVVYDGVKDTDVMEIYWGDSLKPALSQPMTGQTAGNLLELTIPWAKIEAAGNAPSVPVQYGIHNGVKPNNEQKCVPISVKVNAINIPAPGKPTYPTAYTFNGFELVNCTSLRVFSDSTVGVPVNIPALADAAYKLKSGDLIEIHWAPLDTAGTPIPGAAITLSTALNDSMIQSGFSWEIKPFDEVVKPIFDFAEELVVLKTTYSFNVDGKKVVSDVAEIPLAMTDPDYTICDIPTIPFP